MAVNLSKKNTLTSVVVSVDPITTGRIVGRREAYVLVLLDHVDEIVEVPTHQAR
jgi:hypothetical protein